MKCVCVAMEASGDLLGAKILHAMRTLNPHLQASGIAGPQMRNAGCDSWDMMESYQVMGLIDVVKKFPSLIALEHRLVSRIQKEQPTCILFLDSPSFGLRCASLLKRKQIPITSIQVVAPSVWAWGKERRMQRLQASIDHLIPLFAFEEPLFSPYVPTSWFGHPFFGAEFFCKGAQKSEYPLLALFPGSRPGEIQRNLPIQLQTVQLLQKKIPKLHIGIALSHSLSPSLNQYILKELSKSSILHYTLYPSSERYLLMETAWAALAKCGTCVLELFLKKTPTVVCYTIGTFERLWAKYVLQLSTPFYSLPNLLAKKAVVQELIHPQPTIQELAFALTPLLQCPQAIHDQDIHTVRAQVCSETCAEESIAQYIWSHLS